MTPRNLITVLLVLAVTHYGAFQFGQSQLYYKAAASPTKPSGNAPKGVYGVNQVLEFSPSRVDFGTVPDGESQTRTVRFVNRGSEEVSIQKVKASCGCTTARLVTGADVPPGGKGEIEVVFNPALSSPEFSVSVSISYDDRREIDRLLISGKIDRDLSF